MHKNKTKEPLFHIAKRAALPWYLSWAIRIGAIVLALVACAALTVFLTHENPFQVYATMFRGAFSTPPPDMEPAAKFGYAVVRVPGVDPCVQNAVLEHRRRGSGADRRSGNGGVYDLPGWQDPQCVADIDDDRSQYAGRCHLGADPRIF